MTDLRQDPKTSDGKKILMVSKYRGDWQQWFPGADDATPKGKGNLFGISHAGNGASTPFTWNWNDPVYIGGGWCKYEGAKFGDYVSFRFFAPATPTSSTPGTGNVNLSPYGGGNIIVPAPLGDGSHTVDLTAATGTAIPIPDSKMDTPDQAGYWNYANPDEGIADVVAVANPGAPNGGWHLFDFPMTLVDYVPKMPLLGTGVVSYSVDVNPKKILPQWCAEVILFNCDGTHTVEAVWWLEASRKKTY